MSVIRQWRRWRGGWLVLALVVAYICFFGAFTLGKHAAFRTTAFDLGNVAVAQTIAQNAADLAVQEAAKWIDMGTFIHHQQVVLSPEALAVANLTVGDMTDGRMTVRRLEVRNGGRQIYLEGEVRVETLIMPLIGITEVRREVRAIAEPAYGIQEEGD